MESDKRVWVRRYEGAVVNKNRYVRSVTCLSDSDKLLHTTGTRRARARVGCARGNEAEGELYLLP